MNLKKQPLLYCRDPSQLSPQLVRVIARDVVSKTATVVTSADRQATVPFSWFVFIVCEGLPKNAVPLR